MFNILICNSSKGKSDYLAREISKFCSAQSQCLMSFQNQEALLSYLEESNPEANILIIDLEFCQDGIGVADRAIRVNPWLGIIFYSSSGKWDLSVYDIDHAYGLEHHFSKDRLTTAINKAIDKIIKAQTNILPVKDRGIIYPVNIREIQYLEQDCRVINIHTQEQAYSMYIKFEEFNKENRAFFARCHNSFVVNFIHVQAMKDCSFLMRNGARIPISRSRRNQALQEYEAYITRQPVNNA